ncbi:MAG: hypothetical protein ACM3PY_17285, partial [Omnitrophica WOR_2 bacterium]
RQWAGVRPLFQTDQPSAEAAGLVGDKHGYAVLANHCARELLVNIETSLPLTSVQWITPNGPEPLSLDSQQWQIPLDPYGGAVIEWTI